MARKFSLKIYQRYELINYYEEFSFNQETKETEYTPESKEFCLTYIEYIFNLEIDKPVYEVRESFENVHNLFTEKNFATNKVKREKFLLSKNKQQANIANVKLAEWRRKKIAFPESITVLRRIQYLETVLTEFDHWFEHKTIKPTIGSNKSKQSHILPNQSDVTMKLAVFMRELLKDKAAEKYLRSKASDKSKVKYVTDAIAKKPLIIEYKSETLERYIEPKKILEFLPKKK